MHERHENMGREQPSGGRAPLGFEPTSTVAATFAATQARRGVAQPGRAPDSGSGGWGFDSLRPDHAAPFPECEHYEFPPGETS